MILMVGNYIHWD